MSVDHQRTRLGRARIFAVSGVTAGWLLVFVPIALLAMTIVAADFGGELLVRITDLIHVGQLRAGAGCLAGLVIFTSTNLAFASIGRRRGWRLSASFAASWAVVGALALCAWRAILPGQLLIVGPLVALWLQATVSAPLLVVAFAIASTKMVASLVRRSRAWSVAIGAGTWLAGIVIGTGLFVLVVAGISLSATNPDDDVVLARPGPFGAFLDTAQFVEEEVREQLRAERRARRAGLTVLARVSLTVRSAYASTERRDFCFATLLTRKDGEPDGKIDQAARYLRFRARLTFDDARDLAVDKAIDVCAGFGSRAAVSEEAVRGFYWRAVENAGKDALRRQAAAEKREAVRPGHTEPSPLEALELRELRRCVSRALDALAPKSRSLLLLCVEFSARELEARGIGSRSTVNRQCREVTARMRQTYERLCEGPPDPFEKLRRNLRR